VQYRTLQETDMDRVLAIFRDACDACEAPHLPGSRSLERVRCQLKARLPGAFVAEDSDEILGWAALTNYHEKHAYRPTAEFWLYVDRRARRRGIGGTLAQKVIQCARVSSLRSLVLYVLPEPAFVLDSAKALGFVESGRLYAVFPVHGEWKDLIALQLGLRPAKIE
jgi:L-amino acid N-acyltransferase YncA